MAKTFSNFPENVISDSLCFKKIKGFCLHFCFFQWLPRYRIVRVFLSFLTVWTYFKKTNFWKHSWADDPSYRTWNSIYKCFRNITKLFWFFNSAPLLCTTFLLIKRVFGTKSDLKWVGLMINWFCFFFATDSWNTGLSCIKFTELLLYLSKNKLARNS